LNKKQLATSYTTVTQTEIGLRELVRHHPASPSVIQPARPCGLQSSKK